MFPCSLKKEGGTRSISRNSSILLYMMYLQYNINNMRTVNAALERWSKKVVKNTTAVEHSTALPNLTLQSQVSIPRGTKPPPRHFSSIYASLWPTARGETSLALYHPSEGFTLWSCMVVRASVSILMTVGSCCNGYEWSVVERMIVTS